jgi:hypothetical protein
MTASLLDLSCLHGLGAAYRYAWLLLTSRQNVGRDAPCNLKSFSDLLMKEESWASRNASAAPAPRDAK